MKIDLNDRINVCSDCFAVVNGGLCHCGCTRSIKMSSMAHAIMQVQEDNNAPIHTIDDVDYLNVELVKAAGVAR